MSDNRVRTPRTIAAGIVGMIFLAIPVVVVVLILTDTMPVLVAVLVFVWLGILAGYNVAT